MSVENGEWIMRGLEWDNPYRIRTWRELVNWIKEIGFLPLFGNEVEGFSVEEHTSPDYWWSGNRQEDPWEWREIIAASTQVAYGKFFGNKAGFISLEWLPYFVNFRRAGYDFDSRYQDGLASRREKKIMDFFISEDEEGNSVYKDDRILSTDLKKMAGFGKGGEKNYSGISTGLQMQTYLVVKDFKPRLNKKGEEYGWSVAIMTPPEYLWEYKFVTGRYKESPEESFAKIAAHISKHFDCDEKAVRKIL
jgi:hypothetical protein